MARKSRRGSAAFDPAGTVSVRKFLFDLFEQGYDPDDALLALKTRLRARPRPLQPAERAEGAETGRDRAAAPPDVSDSAASRTARSPKLRP